MKKTIFAGLSILEPGEPLSDDNGAFTGRDRVTTDHLLEVGAKTHRHTGASGIATPSVAPVASVIASGGAIPADLAISLGYTFEDAQGGETMLSPVTVVSTGGAVTIPPAPPVAVVNTGAGELLVNTYYYAVTFTDGEGGETPLGPAVSAQRQPGFANSEVQLSGLNTGLVAAGAAGWRLYRAIGGNAYNLLASGGASEATFVDDGTHSLDCSTHPPAGELNTTVGVSTLSVTLPSAVPIDAATMNLYASVSGDFSGGSFLATFPRASAGSTTTFATLALEAISPPVVNLSIGGAHQIDPDTELIDWHWKRPVATEGDLPTEAEGAEEGDVRVSLADHSAFIFVGGEWITWIGGGGGGGGGSLGVDAVIDISIHDSFDSGLLDTNWEALLFVGESFIEPSEFWEETGGHLVKPSGGGIAFRKDSRALDGRVQSKFGGEESFACHQKHLIRSLGAEHHTGANTLLAGYEGGLGHGSPAHLKIEILEDGETFVLASAEFTEPIVGDYWVVTVVEGPIVRCLFYDEDPTGEPAPLHEIEANLEEEPGSPSTEASVERREHYTGPGLFGLVFVGAPGGLTYEWEFVGSLDKGIAEVTQLSFQEGDKLGINVIEDGARVTIPGRAGAMGYVNCEEDLTKARPAFDAVTWLVTGGAGEPANMANGDFLIEVEGASAKQFVRVGGSLVEV